MKKILLVFGTRPEAIKMAPLVKELKLNSSLFQTFVCVTGQHRQMLDQVLDLFEIVPDYDLNIMKPNQDLFDITSLILTGLKKVLEKIDPDLVLVHGDTTTSVVASLTAFYKRISVGHVEAGLRTYNTMSPWPEEMNRQLTARIANYHFCPTQKSKENLLKESINPINTIVTGNTVIDSLHYVLKKINDDVEIKTKCLNIISSSGYDSNRIAESKRFVLITGHRRENFGNGFVNMCMAIKLLALKYPDVDFVYPMHLNPNVRTPVLNILSSPENKNVFLIEPLEYMPFVYMMSKCFLILTDSGGIQEEAPGLGIPVLVMRDTTERPEAVDAGTVKLVGTDSDRIINEVSLLLDSKELYEKMSKSVNPYGDGFASKRIVDFIRGINN